jgi:hypothetical protein
MNWEPIKADDPRQWTKDEQIEGKLIQGPAPTTGSPLIVIRPESGDDIAKFCPTKLYGPLAAIPTNTTIRILCHGKVRQPKTRTAAWEFSVFQKKWD